MLPKISKFLLNWQNFAKSGHTESITPKSITTKLERNFFPYFLFDAIARDCYFLLLTNFDKIMRFAIYFCRIWKKYFSCLLENICSQEVWPDWADLLHFEQRFKASGNNHFAQIAPILGNFVKVSKSFIFLVESFLGIFYRHLSTYYWSRCSQGSHSRKRGRLRLPITFNFFFTA